MKALHSVDGLTKAQFWGVLELGAWRQYPAVHDTELAIFMLRLRDGLSLEMMEEIIVLYSSKETKSRLCQYRISVIFALSLACKVVASGRCIMTT